MKIAIISGSVRKGRRSHHVAVELQKRFMINGYLQTDIIDLAEYGLPILEEERYHMHPSPTAEMVEIHNKLNDADAIIFLSPEYHGSYTGALKNAVDYYWSEFAKKPIGVVAISAGKFGGINTSTHLQQLVLSLGAYPMPTKLLVPMVQNAFNDKGEIIDEPLSKTFDRFVTEFAWFADAIVSKKQRKEKQELLS
ncbi:MAG: hypothetical protein JWO06_2780 [Bacteroidota bacterium]|nr:hypothetical protein [Bacteroidota bacterium]